MFGNLNLQAARQAMAAPRQDGETRGRAASLLRVLGAARVEPQVLETPAGLVAGGATVPVSVAACLQPEGDDAWRRILCIARAGVPVTLALRELGPGETATEALETFCTALRERLAAHGIAPARIGMSLHSHVVPLEAYRLLSAALLGDGARYVILDALQMRPHGARAERAAARNWGFLWRCRGTRRPLVPAYAGGVSTRCALLGDEAAGAVLPGPGIQVPAESAWLPLTLRLPDFADEAGRLDWQRLGRALNAAVDAGEALLEHLSWPDPALAADAAENRRLGLELTGLGDLVAARRTNPSDLECLRWLDGVVARVHALLWERSRSLARERGPLPSLVRSEPAIGWRCDKSRSDWQQRWRRALAESGVRHRNLLVLSPYAILPRGARHASDYLDLLPVLAHADAFAFARPPAACFGSAGELARFHRRAWAVMQRRHAASIVAVGV